MELIVRLPTMLIIWVLSWVVKLPTMLLGLVVIPFTYLYKHTSIEEIPWILTPWINPEDQVGGFPGYPDSLPTWWKRTNGFGFWSHYKYHAIRNPADGLRNYKLLNVVPDPARINYITNGYMRHYEPKALRARLNGDRLAWYICWQKFHMGLKIVYTWNAERHLVIKFGFRIQPSDEFIANIDTKGTRYLLGASMANKFLPYRKG